MKKRITRSAAKGVFCPKVSPRNNELDIENQCQKQPNYNEIFILVRKLISYYIKSLSFIFNQGKFKALI